MPARMGRGWTSVQARLTALTVAVTTLAVLALVLSRSSETRRIDAYLAADATAHGELLDRTLELEGGSLAVLASDYSYWDEMVQFVQTRDLTWASVNLDEALNTYRANAEWVFDSAGSLVYAVRDSALEALIEPVPPGLSVKDAFDHDRLCHFFIAGPDGPVEIRGATIHPSDDPERKTPVRGYFLAARLWDGQYLTGLARVTGKTMRIEPARAGAKPSAEVAQGSGEIKFIRPLPGPRGKPELTLTASLRPGWITVARRSGRGLFVQLTTLALLGVLGLTLALWFWVTRPLGWIRRSLESDSTEALKPLERSRTEFGQLAGLVGQFFGQNAALVKEVTERRQAEAALRESEQRFRDVAMCSADWVWEVNAQLRYTFCSEHVKRVTGYESGELLGRTPFDLIPEVERTRIAPGFAALVAERKPLVDLENRMLTKDGREVVMLTNGVPMLDDAGNLLGYRGVAKDITERKRADDALHESEKRFRELFDSMSSGVAVYETRDQGVSFIFKDFNQGAERIDSLRREEVVGRNVQQVFPGIEKFGLLAVLRRVWQTGRPERHPVGQYEDDRISGWRENYVYRLASGEVVAVYDDTTARVQAEAALRDSEQRYRETIDALPEAVFETGPDGQLTFVNRAGLAAFGLAEADIARGVNVLQVLVPEDRERAAANIRQVVGGESRPGTEYMALRKDGSRFPAIVHADRIIRNGQPVGLRGILVDISARKLAEDALRESEEKYRLVVDNAGEAVLVVQDGKMVFTNPRTSEIIEYPREELLGRPFVEFIHPDDRAFVADNYRRRIAGEDVPVWYEFRVVRRDGEARHVDINGVRIDWNGRSATLNFLSDVTERRAAESGLRESELKFRAIFDNASDGMFLIEQESRRFVLANSSCLRMLGYSADEFVNLRITDLHPEEDLPFIFEQIGAFVKGETGRRGDTRFKRKDGSLLPADTSPAGMMLGDKKCILIMFRDITEQKQAEAEIAQKNTQLIELNAVKNQLLGMAAHDLRNPLSVVSTASAFLLDDAGRLLPEAKRTDFLRRINFSSEFMLKMIDDLLDVARIEAGKLDLKLEDGDLCCLIEENLTMNRMLAKKKDIRLDFASERGLPLFRFDRGKVEQVLNNLISNALKFSEPGTAVTVQASRVNGSVVVSVRDHGQGIPAEELDKLFKPFSKTSVRGTGGERSTGLGLAICRKIVEGHHGRIWAESEVGKGSVFSFSLPVPVAALE